MTRFRVLALAALLLGGGACAHIPKPADARPVLPATATGATAEWQQLLQRRAAFTGAQSLLHVRLSTGGGAQSFRARLAVDAAGRMELDALTPFGTSAFVVYADGDRVTFVNHLQRSWWQGSAAELARSIGFFAASARPVDFAMLLLGLPANRAAAYAPRDGVPCASGICPPVAGAAVMGSGALTYETLPTGFNRIAALADRDLVLATFTPAVYPPQTLIVEHYTATGLAERLDVEHLDLVATSEPLTPPEVPANYQPGVRPRV